MNTFNQRALAKDEQKKIKKDHAKLFKENGFDIVGTLGFHKGWLDTVANYTLKRNSEDGGVHFDEVFTGVVIQTGNHAPAIVSLRKL